MSKKYTDKDLMDILTEVEVEFKKHLTPDSKENQITKSNTSKENSSEYNEEELGTIEELYKSMDKNEVEMHYNSLKKAMFGDSKVETDMKKSEESKSEEETKMLKSENEELKKTLDKLTQIVTKVFSKNPEAPKQKAITSMEVVKKSEEETKIESKDFSKISKEEINKTLTAKIRSGKIEKNDKEAINNFIINNGSIELIKHLL